MKRTEVDLDAVDWPDMLIKLGIDAEYLNKKHGPCPIQGCEGKRSFRFDDKGGKGGWICTHCGAGNGFTLAKRSLGLTDRELFDRMREVLDGTQYNSVTKTFDADVLSPEEVEKRKTRLNTVWRTAKIPGATSPVIRYLCNRVPGLQRAMLSDQIRATVMRFFDEDGVDHGKFHVLLSRASWQDRKTPVTLHRIYLTADGRKAPFENVKKQMQSHLKLDGAAVRVNSAADRATVYVCEGLETAVAIVMMDGNRHPVYAALNAGNLANFKPPKFAKKIVVCADNDCPDKRGVCRGIQDATALIERLKACGLETDLRIPDRMGWDYADVWMSSQSQAA